MHLLLLVDDRRHPLLRQQPVALLLVGRVEPGLDGLQGAGSGIGLMADLVPGEPGRIGITVDHVQVDAERPAARTRLVLGGLQLRRRAERRRGRVDLGQVAVEAVALPAVRVEEEVVLQAVVVGRAADQLAELPERAVPAVHAEAPRLPHEARRGGNRDMPAVAERAVERPRRAHDERQRRRLRDAEAEGPLLGRVVEAFGRRLGGDDEGEAVRELEAREAAGVLVAVERQRERAGILHVVAVAEVERGRLLGAAPERDPPEVAFVPGDLRDKRIPFGPERDGRHGAGRGGRPLERREGERLPARREREAPLSVQRDRSASRPLQLEGRCSPHGHNRPQRRRNHAKKQTDTFHVHALVSSVGLPARGRLLGAFKVKCGRARHGSLLLFRARAFPCRKF